MTKEIIDLRSDTLTVPDQGMLEAMLSAKVGDDVYSEDPTVLELEHRVAEYFGMESALYTPTGTMANQIALNINTSVGDEIICEKDAHIFYYETSAPSILSNIQLNPLPSETGMPSLDLIEETIRPDVYYFPKTSLFCLENTHNRHGGTILELEYIQKFKELADKNNIHTHLDGARVWNAIVASDYSGKDLGQYFNTISVCLSKGMGTPMGSLVLGTKEDMKKALKFRKILGGGMRQIGYMAACGLYALDNNLDKLKFDHQNAKTLANKLITLNNLSVDISKVQTNMLVFKLDKAISAEQFVKKADEQGLKIMHIGGNNIRVVFHLNINEEKTKLAGNIIEKVIKNFTNNI